MLLKIEYMLLKIENITLNRIHVLKITHVPNNRMCVL